jgi:chemotaxis-related protein WspB
MLLLLFEIGSDRYALDARQIIEVVPLVRLKLIPNTPDHIAGLMNYRGAAIPVIDLCRLLTDIPCENSFSTRIIIVKHPVENNGEVFLALMANNVTETVQTSLEAMPPSGTIMAETLYGGGSGSDSSELIQWFDVEKIIPEKDFLLPAGE